MICIKCGKNKPATIEYFSARKNGALRIDRPCRECIEIEHRDYDRIYSREHAVERAVRTRQWAKDHRLANKVRAMNERALAKGLPATLTEQQVAQCLTYFNRECAVCGRSEMHGVRIHLDHWIPITDPNCPGSVVSNIIPLCGSRRGSTFCCNNTKHNRDPIEWLFDEYGEESASQKLARINAYFNALDYGYIPLAIPAHKQIAPAYQHSFFDFLEDLP